MIKLISIFAFTLLALVFNDLTHSRTITGAVTDSATGKSIAGILVAAKGTNVKALTDGKGKYAISVPLKVEVLVFSGTGYLPKEVKLTKAKVLNVQLTRDPNAVNEVAAKTHKYTAPVLKEESIDIKAEESMESSAMAEMDVSFAPPEAENYNTEAYDAIHESGFLETTKNPLSTFSIDVDNAAYSNVRRFLNSGQKPPKDAVRIEEMINYFRYNYPQPVANIPFSVTTEIAPCPWNKENRLVHIGLQGKKIPTDKLPPSNLVFLLDVSGSMAMAGKLSLVKAGFKMLVEQVRPQDKVAIVVYAGAAGLVLPSTPGNEKEKMLAAIKSLEAGGSTAGGEGINLAYKVAQENFRKGGNNRVILATDGDFNVGVSSDAEMERLIEQKRETGIFLTVLGFGTGNLKDSKMEKIADKGNGNYAYVDNISEARKVFVSEFGGTLFTIAKDVKLQLEFNPVRVKAYRLIGYENRALRNEEFNDDKKDAGDMGAGHTVTALYEIVPARGKSSSPVGTVDPLKYQTSTIAPTAGNSDEVLTLKLRYKEPDGQKSSLIQTTVKDKTMAENQTSENFRFSAAVAQFGMLLRDSEFKGNATYDQVISMASGAKGKDEEGYRSEFINLVRAAKTVAIPDKK
jgi:Ca-activated chloride channel family protein